MDSNKEMSEGWQERFKNIVVFAVVVACFSFAFYQELIMSQSATLTNDERLAKISDLADILDAIEYLKSKQTTNDAQ